MERLSWNGGGTAVHVGEVCDNGTSVDNGEMVDDGVEESYNNKISRRGQKLRSAPYAPVRCRGDERGTSDNTLTRHGWHVRPM